MVVNPWQVLGLKPGADRAEIRRAYARLLKCTNPEDDPEGFMQLRAAHDAALNQLQWRQQWGDEGDAEDDAPAATPPLGVEEAPPAPAAAPREDPQLAAERADLFDRQEALIAAIAAGPDGQRAAFEALLAAPALDGVVARAGVETWLAALIAGSLPASDPLVVPAIDQFGWEDLPRDRTPPSIAALLRRREEGEFVARIARPHAELHIGYMALSKPPGPRWLLKLGALFSAAPAQTRAILGLADGPMPGILDWLDGAAVAAWRDWHARARLRLWMIVSMLPLAAVVLLGLLEASGWPEPVQQGVGLLAWGAPFGLLAVLRGRQRLQDDWDRPEWHYSHWPLAVAALPLLAALWPAVPALTPLFLAPVLAAATWMLLVIDRLEPPSWREFFPGLIRSQPAWLFLLLLIGGSNSDAGAPVRVLACAALALAWWQAGDALAWMAERFLGARAVWALVAAAVGTGALALLLAALGGPARGLALLPLALIGLLLSLRLARGWWQALPAVGLAGLALLLFELVSRIDASLPGAAGALSELARADLFIDPATGLPRAPVITGLLVGGIAVWQARRRGLAGWPLRILIIAIGLFTILRPLVDERRPARPAEPPRVEVPVASGDSATWLSVGDTLKGAAPGAYHFVVELDVGASWGRVVACRLKQGTGVVALDQSLCPQLKEKARYRPTQALTEPPRVVTVELRGGWTVKAPAAPALPAALPVARAAPVIRCPETRVRGPMVAEPCRRDAWIGTGDYPAGPLARGESGTVGYRLAVNPQGRVARCDVIRSSGHAGLDRDTCALLSRRARFVPAQDIDGSPMAWDYESAIAWQLAPR